MSNTFSLKKMKIVLYGVNHYTLRHCLELEKEGYFIEAFIDKRAGKIDGQNKKIFTCGDFVEKYKKVDDICIIIMLQNALQHDEIAVAFIKEGFNRLIFVPMHRYFIENYELEMRHLYNAFLNYQYNLLSNIPILYADKYTRKNSVKARIIKEEGNNLLLWVEKELIYSNPVSIVKGNYRREEYADIPLCAFRPYIEMMKYIMYGVENENFRYLEDYGRNSCQYETTLTNNDVIKQRKNLIEIFEREINFGMDFFISSAPQAEWNKKGYFNLLEGQHRCLFLLLKGANFIPIRVKKSDFKLWEYNCAYKNTDIAQISNMKYPILHPFFFESNIQLRCQRCIYLDDIFNFFDNLDIEGLTVYDVSLSKGYFARNLVRRNAQCAYVYGKGEIREEIELINKIENINRIKITEKYINTDIAIIFDWLIYKDLLVKKVLQQCRYIFLACSKNHEKEIFHDFPGKKMVCLNKIYYLNQHEKFWVIYSHED